MTLYLLETFDCTNVKIETCLYCENYFLNIY